MFSQRSPVRHHRLMQLVLRRGVGSEAAATAEPISALGMQQSPAIPLMVHTDEETRRWISQRVVPESELWVAETPDGAVVGMLVLDEVVLTKSSAT